MPTSSATTTVRGSSVRPVFGSVKPTASNSQNRPEASARPSRRPTTDATIPTISASMITETRTWRRDAPRVRRVANSRMRCAIVIASEFAITNEPTKSAIPANASRNPRRKEMNSFVSAASSVACCWPESACAFGGRISRISARSSWSLTPGFEATAISSRRPSFWNSRCAVGRSKPASVAPPIERSVPNSTMPEMRSRSTGPSTCTPIPSPISKSSLSATPESITISSGPGQEPATSRSGLKGESPSAIEKPRLGAPP